MQCIKMTCRTLCRLVHLSSNSFLSGQFHGVTRHLHPVAYWENILPVPVPYLHNPGTNSSKLTVLTPMEPKYYRLSSECGRVTNTTMLTNLRQVLIKTNRRTVGGKFGTFFLGPHPLLSCAEKWVRSNAHVKGTAEI